MNIDYDTAIESLETWDLYPFSNKTSSKIRAITNLTAQNLSMNISHFNSKKYDKYTFPLLNPARASYVENYGSSNGLSEFTYAGEDISGSSTFAQTIYNKVLNKRNIIQGVIDSLANSFLRENVYSKYNGKVIKDLASGRYYNGTIKLLDNFDIVSYITPGGNKDLT